MRSVPTERCSCKTQGSRRKTTVIKPDYVAILFLRDNVAGAFLDLLEDYFAQPQESLKRDERPELGYQVGVTL